MRKNKVVLFGVLLLVILAAYYAQYHFKRFKVAEHIEFVAPEKSEKFTVGIVGDSWVASQKLDTMLHNRLINYGIENRIVSYGIPGATSKVIYENFDQIISKSPDVCIIIAGVNDSALMYPSSYYQHHVGLMVASLREVGIEPIILELPHYNRNESIKKLKFKIRSLSYVGAIINGNVNEPLSNYRINYDVKFPELKPNHYRDQAHLNTTGNQKLAQALADYINKINYYESRSCKNDAQTSG